MDGSSLGCLPPELRNNIYEFALQQDDPVVFREKIKHCLALTSTCKDIRHEATKVFYCVNSFEVKAPKAEPYFNAAAFNRNLDVIFTPLHDFATAIGASNWRMVHSLTFGPVVLWTRYFCTRSLENPKYARAAKQAIASLLKAARNVGGGDLKFELKLAFPSFPFSGTEQFDSYTIPFADRLALQKEVQVQEMWLQNDPEEQGDGEMTDRSIVTSSYWARKGRQIVREVMQEWIDDMAEDGP